VGSDATEQQCETACLDVMNSQLLDTTCPFICSSFQTLVQKLHTTPTNAPSNKRFLTSSFGDGWSWLMSFFSTDSLRKKVDLIVDEVGSDATEQQCETACLDVMNSQLLDTTCPFICSSFQTLVQKLHTTPTNAPSNKRFLTSNFNLDLNHIAQEVLTTLSNDETEAGCETACSSVVGAAASGIVCPSVCTLVQQLAQTGAANTHGKRFILGVDIAKIAQEILATIGTDETEAQCETECANLVGSTWSGLACPTVCTLVQQLAQATQGKRAAEQKRFLLDSFDLHEVLQLLGANSLDQALNEVVAQVGSDASEAECEKACRDSTGLPSIACPVICSSFQELIKGFHVTEANSTAPAS